MPISTQDFVAGIDFTALIAANGSQHNQLINLGTPGPDAGLNIPTIDSALNTPVVPDAVVNAKWKRYLWKRSPHATATSQSPLLYAWSDNAIAVATFLKWIQVTIDADTLQHIIDNTVDIAELKNVNKDVAYVVSVTAGASIVGENVRVWDYVVNNNRALIQYLGAGIVRCLVSGDFLVSGFATAWKFNNVAVFKRNDIPANLIVGSAMYSNAADLNLVSVFNQVVPLIATATYKLSHYVDTANGNGLGKDPGTVALAGVNPVFAQVNFKRLS